MSISYVNRINDEDIIDITRRILNNGTGKAETINENILIKLMQIRNTPIQNMIFDQERVDNDFELWMDKKDETRRQYHDLYHELTHAVQNKHPGETRHETALRYIEEREKCSNQVAMEKTEE